MDEPTPPELKSDETEPPAKRARHRQPKSPEAKARGLAARALERKLDALKNSKDAKKMEQATALLARLEQGGEPEKPPAPSSEPPREQPAAAPEPSEVRGAPAGSNPRGPGWPSEQAIAELAPLVKDGVDQLALLLKGTRFAIDAQTGVDVGGTIVSVRKADQLAAGLTPLAAKYLPTALNTPEAAAVLALVMVFGVPLFQLAMEKATAGHAGTA